MQKQFIQNLMNEAKSLESDIHEIYRIKYLVDDGYTNLSIDDIIKQLEQKLLNCYKTIALHLAKPENTPEESSRPINSFSTHLFGDKTFLDKFLMNNDEFSLYLKSEIRGN
jgi:hypothetical protein